MKPKPLTKEDIVDCWKVPPRSYLLISDVVSAKKWLKKELKPPKEKEFPDIVYSIWYEIQEKVDEAFNIE